jgi:hypothetical protein
VVEGSSFPKIAVAKCYIGSSLEYISMYSAALVQLFTPSSEFIIDGASKPCAKQTFKRFHVFQVCLMRTPFIIQVLGDALQAGAYEIVSFNVHLKKVTKSLIH